MNCNPIYLLIVLSGPASGISQQEKCLMRPQYTEIAFPHHGFRLLTDEESRVASGEVPDTAWTILGGRQYVLYVRADGPRGSGRVWNISVGISSVNRAGPERGFSFVTATVGWRTLQQFDQVPLTWVNDEDADGDPELILWDSFPLSDEPSVSAFGLVAWVYRIDTTGVCRIDWNLSRQKASEIADAYRVPLAEGGSAIQDLRADAAEALENFVTGKCAPEHEEYNR